MASSNVTRWSGGTLAGWCGPLKCAHINYEILLNSKHAGKWYTYNRAHERGYPNTRHCQNFSSHTRHWGQKMPDTRQSKFTPTLDVQLKKCVSYSQHERNSNYTKSTLDTVIFKSTSDTVKYLSSALDTDPPFKGPYNLLAPWSCSRTMIEGFAHW